MEETRRQGPIPVREMMAHLSADQRAMSDAPEPDAARPERPPIEVTFTHRGTTWTAREAGSATWGTDIRATSTVVAVHFFHPDRPQRPAHEALLPRGRLGGLHAAELVALFEASAEVPPEGTVIAGRRRGGGRTSRGTRPRGGRSARGRPRSGGGTDSKGEGNA